MQRYAVDSAAALVLALGYAVAFSALIFSGERAAGFGTGVYSALFAVAIGGFAAAYFSRFATAMSGPDGNATAVLAAAALSLTPIAASEQVPTMLAILVLATLFTGAAFLTIGLLRGSRAIRYIPAPLVGGFNAASGLLVMLGSLRILGGFESGLKIAISAALALTIVTLSRRIGSLAMPLVLAIAIVASLTIVRVFGIPLEHVRLEGWFFDVPAARPWIPVMSWQSAISWPAVLMALPAIAVVALVSVTTMLFNATGLELLTGGDVDLDHELRVGGIANLLGACAGGMVSYISFARSSMVYQLGVRNRSVGTGVAIGAAAAIAIGPARVLDLLPVVAPAALLMALGGNMVYRWLIVTRPQQSIGDYLTLCAIFFAIVIFGFVPGIIVGLAFGSVTFVVRYARIDAVAERSTVASRRSNLERSLHEAEVLAQYGDRVRIFTLRGYIFFGTADRLYRELLASAAEIDDIGWIVVDFTGVHGMDASAAAAFVKFARTVDPDRVSFMLCGMSERVATRWNATLDAHLHPFIFESRDLALEHCESQLLMLFDSYAETPLTLDLWLDSQLGTAVAARLRAHLIPLELDTGTVLCEAGDPSDGIYFVERGRVAVLDGQALVRVASVGPLAIVGEMGLYRRSPRTATIVAEMPSRLHRLSSEAFAAIEREDAFAAAAFHACVVRVLADRLERRNAG